MKKILLILSLIPVLGIAQNSTSLSAEEKLQVKMEQKMHFTYQIASKTQNQSMNKSLMQVLDSSTYYEDDGSGGHYMLYKHHYFYNTGGLNTTQFFWLSDFSDDTIGKTVNQFDGANNLISSMTYTKLGDNFQQLTYWLDDSKSYYYYTNNKLTHQIDSTYDETLQQYELYLDFTLTYDGSNRVTEIFGDFGIPGYNHQKLIFEYNVDGTLKREMLQFHDPINDVYNNQRIYDFEYVGQNSTKTKRQRYDTPNQVMVDDGSLIKYYDLNFTKNDLILPTGLLWVDIFQIMPEDLVGSYTNKLDSLYQYGDTLSTNYWGKNIFYYNQKDIVGTNELNSSKFEIFPNPTTGKINFKNLSQNVDFQVFDIYGKLILELKNTSSNTLDLSSLANGIYHLSIYDKENNTLNTEKILLNK